MHFEHLCACTKFFVGKLSDGGRSIDRIRAFLDNLFRVVERRRSKCFAPRWKSYTTILIQKFRTRIDGMFNQTEHNKTAVVEVLQIEAQWLFKMLYERFSVQ